MPGIPRQRRDAVNSGPAGFRCDRQWRRRWRGPGRCRRCWRPRARNGRSDAPGFRRAGPGPSFATINCPSDVKSDLDGGSLRAMTQGILDQVSTQYPEGVGIEVRHHRRLRQRSARCDRALRFGQCPRPRRARRFGDPRVDPAAAVHLRPVRAASGVRTVASSLLSVDSMSAARAPAAGSRVSDCRRWACAMAPASGVRNSCAAFAAKLRSASKVALSRSEQSVQCDRDRRDFGRDVSVWNRRQIPRNASLEPVAKTPQRREAAL